MHKRAFQALKRTFMDVSGLPRLSLMKNRFLKYFVFYQKAVGEDLRHA